MSDGKGGGMEETAAPAAGNRSRTWMGFLNILGPGLGMEDTKQQIFIGIYYVPGTLSDTENVAKKPDNIPFLWRAYVLDNKHKKQAN